MSSHEQQAAEYRRLALAERALVGSSTLVNVREKHELSAARWDDLAEQTERAIAAHLARVRAASIRRLAAPEGFEGEAGGSDSLIPNGV